MSRAAKTRVKVYSTSRNLIIALALVFTSLTASTGLSILYTNRVERESNQAWCEILNSLAKRNSEILNPDAATLEFRGQLARLRKFYEC